MSRASRWNPRRGLWRPRHLEADDARRAATDPPPIPVGAPAPRIHHPATKAPTQKCYRVVRHYRQRDALQFEDLGGFATPLAALQMIGRELGRARILGPDGKVFSDNWQPIEDRD